MSGSALRSPTRREFIVGSAAATLAATVSRGSAENLGYIDCHSHLWSPERARYPLRSGAKEEDVKPQGFTPGDFFSHARLKRKVSSGVMECGNLHASVRTLVLKQLGERCQRDVREHSGMPSFAPRSWRMLPRQSPCARRELRRTGRCSVSSVRGARRF